jgi:hypothetical protein
VSEKDPNDVEEEETDDLPSPSTKKKNMKIDQKVSKGK